MQNELLRQRTNWSRVMLLNGDLGKLRDRLRWLANRAAAEGHPEYARLLMQLAAETFGQAEDIKQHAKPEDRRQNAVGCF